MWVLFCLQYLIKVYKFEVIQIRQTAVILKFVLSNCEIMKSMTNYVTKSKLLKLFRGDYNQIYETYF